MVYWLLQHLHLTIMKNKNLIFIILSSFMLLFVTACSDNNDDIDKSFPGGTKAKLLPVKIYKEEFKETQEFEYDNLNRLTKYKLYSTATDVENKLRKAIEIKYNEAGAVSEYIESANQVTFLYTATYSESEVILENPTYKINIKLDGQSRILNVIETYPPKVEANRTHTYEYDALGNIAKYSYDEKYWEYSYDDKNGIYSQIKSPQWILELILDKNELPLANNCTSLRTYYKKENTGEELYGFLYKRAYVYNDNGYPVKYKEEKNYATESTPPDYNNIRIEYREAKSL